MLAGRFNLPVTEVVILREFLGSELLGLSYKRPILEGLAPVLNSDHADDKVGSGVVHISPAFGEDDFILYKLHNLEFIMHLEDDGTINQSGGKYVGQRY